MNKALIIIPARMNASRFQGKPLQEILGKPMIVHCWEVACRASIGDVIVACGDQEIYDCISKVGGTAMMTDPELPSGSDRIYAALQSYDANGDYDVIINMQGDLPSLPDGALQKCLQLLTENPDYDIATLAAQMTDKDDINNPDIVKIMMSHDGNGEGRAYGFSRSPVPYGEGGEGSYYHHLGIYAYRREALATFVSLPPSPLEVRERLEQWRALEADMRIGVTLINEVPPSVDVPADIQKAEAYLAR